MRRVFCFALPLSSNPHSNGIFTTSVKQSSKCGDARFGIGWTTAVADATDEAIR